MPLHAVNLDKQQLEKIHKKTNLNKNFLYQLIPTAVSSAVSGSIILQQDNKVASGQCIA